MDSVNNYGGRGLQAMNLISDCERFAGKWLKKISRVPMSLRHLGLLSILAPSIPNLHPAHFYSIRILLVQAKPDTLESVSPATGGNLERIPLGLSRHLLDTFGKFGWTRTLGTSFFMAAADVVAR